MSLNDQEVTRSIPLRPLAEVAEVLGIGVDQLEMYGDTKAKIKIDMLDTPSAREPGKYIVVTAITPTPLGEGKTVHTVGISQALNKIGKRTCCVIRQASMGPVFGIKGGAAGGGYSQVVPPEEINLHLTGDFHAVTSAHNLCSAFLDASYFHGNDLDIDVDRITWRRVMDVNDRALREIEVARGGEKNGTPHGSGFDITSASEIMAILGLATDLQDLRKRLGSIVVAYNTSGDPVTAEDLKVAGAMAAVLKDALKPTLMQTLEGTPAIVHTGPFANIAHGNSSIIADRIALRSADIVVTEAGFGADMGAEKFFDIKCRASGLDPDAALMVATIRALKMHSGRFEIKAGKPLPEALTQEDLGALSEGLCNLEGHIANVKSFGIPVVVAINIFPTDTEAEIEMVRKAALAAGASAAHVSTMFMDGGAGGEDLAHALVAACEEESNFELLYPDDMSLKEKIHELATKIYGADGVEYEDEAEQLLAQFEKDGFGHLPICMAKTQYSFSHDAALKGRPTGYTFVVRSARVAVGAGFVYPLAGKILTMPGLGRTPGGTRIDINKDGEVVGMF
ncbi:MAG: formate--tetrahydrofolate ligase [Gemmatimonadales bacterium]|jgi:formate--tetrahydrofolate ligase|nr:formate--tetrahydrofolate ligase [Gemmatimonadales bacterium]MBT3775106.1 formate--tetrahydrofolate ligase [Gemmatimonadales bacterium]MBT3958380.1 formate--tetrahydrofolate ligase [Gemmatimonadales bacterium]MBT4437576.1 formate--tetrahydrofolate ligase [Gemmatimonadales bacterium]MBT4914590.1 formate--tetrahydrofolate ligase [Gemmatimonadales bacterium]